MKRQLGALTKASFFFFIFFFLFFVELSFFVRFGFKVKKNNEIFLKQQKPYFFILFIFFMFYFCWKQILIILRVILWRTSKAVITSFVKKMHYVDIRNFFFDLMKIIDLLNYWLNLIFNCIFPSG